MKSLVLLIISILYTLSCSASGLNPNYCNLFGTEMKPISFAFYGFGMPININEGALGKIYLGEQVVAEGSLKAKSGYTTHNSIGDAVVEFEEDLYLPVGNTYQFVIEADVIHAAENPALTNDELRSEFKIPGNIGPATMSETEGSVIPSILIFYFNFMCELNPHLCGDMVLYRNGIPVKHYPTSATWDWGIGSAYTSFGEMPPKNLTFEKDVNFTLQLPAGSVHSRFREDITNEELNFNFIGGYYNPNPPTYLQPDHYEAEFDESGQKGLSIKIFFSKEVALTYEPFIELIQDGISIESATPILITEAGQSILEAHFENYQMIPGKGLTVRLPEATIVTPQGAVYVNAEERYEIQTSRIIDISKKGYKWNVSGTTLKVYDINPGSEVILTTPEGYTILNRKVQQEDELNIEVKSSGIHILTVDNVNTKILVKSPL